MRGSFQGIGRVKQDGGDGIECDERMLVVVDDVTAFFPFKRTAVLLYGRLYARQACQESRRENQRFFPDGIPSRVYRA